MQLKSQLNPLLPIDGPISVSPRVLVGSLHQVHVCRLSHSYTPIWNVASTQLMLAITIIVIIIRIKMLTLSHIFKA